MVDRARLERLHKLLEGAAAAWRLSATIEDIQEEPPTIMVRLDGDSGILVTHQHEGAMPACWETRRVPLPYLPASFADLPVRRYAAVPGLLRAVRAALDPDARTGRLVIGSRPG